MHGLDAAVLAGANPVAVGYGLRNIKVDGDGFGREERGGEGADGEIYIFLLCMDFNGDSRYVSPKIRDCLQDHDLDNKHNAYIRGTNIIVYICEFAGIC